MYQTQYNTHNLDDKKRFKSERFVNFQFQDGNTSLSNRFNTDASFSALFEEQLQMLDNTVMEVMKADRTFLQDIPVQAGQLGATTHTWFMNDINGKAGYISDYSTALPKVGMTGEAYTGRFLDFGVAYDLSVREIQAGNKANVDLEDGLLRSATRSLIELHDNTAYFGAPAKQVYGWLEYSDKNTKAPSSRRVTTLEASGASVSAKKWANKTADEIMKDLTDIVNAIDLRTNSKFMPDTILLPTEQYQRANDVRLLTTATTSVLEEFNRKYPDINVIKRPILKYATDPITGLVIGGLLGKDAMIAYKNDKLCFNQVITEVMNVYPTQAVNLAYTTNFTGRHGGIQMKLPETQCFMYGI
jgi:hypothetical protein